MTIDIGKDLEKFVKLTKEDMEANPPTASDLIGEGESQLALSKANQSGKYSMTMSGSFLSLTQ